MICIPAVNWRAKMDDNSYVISNVILNAVYAIFVMPPTNLY